MAKHPPERYDPGELDRTRRNLGDLSPDQAREMASLFGGEVGVERISPEMEEKYRRLSMLNRRFSDPSLLLPPQEQRVRGKERASAAGIRRRPGYLDRVRNNFRAAAPEFRIIPRIQAYRSLVSFFLPVKETLHPRFITSGEDIFYHSLERVVLALRSLSAINRREEVPSLKDYRSLRIIAVLRDWDIETIHRELSVLQRSPRNQPLAAAARLCRALYRPFFQLIDLDPSSHLMPAVKRLFDLDMMAYPADSTEAARIKRMGSTLRNELMHLFTDVRRRCSPLITGLADLPYAPYPEFFSYFRPRILEFLSLGEEEILPLQAEDLLIEPSEGEVHVGEEEIEEEGDTPDEEPPPIPEKADSALDFLVKLFPQSGFEDIARCPDLFSYFKSIVSFPKNTDLLHPENPVHQIAVLLALIQELLYGFRQVIFGELIDEEGSAKEIQGAADAHVGVWHRLLDEVVCGRLLIDLVDYCRQIERSADYRYSEAGMRQENSIMLRISRTLLPYLSVPAIRGRQIADERSLPRLPVEAAEFHQLLEDALRLAPDGRKPAIKNPHAPFRFEIENYVSLRFRAYLQRQGLPQDNRHLIQHISLLLSLLDYLVNDPASHFYRSDHFPLYRHEEGHREIPIYTVPAMETERIIEGSEVELTPPEEFLDQPGPGKDKVSGLLQARGFETAVKSAVETYHREKSPVTIATVCIPELRILGPEERNDRLRVIGHCVRGEIREYSDLPYHMEDDSIPVILPETSGVNAVRFCRRLIRTILEKLPEAGIHIGIVAYHPTWSPGKLLKTAARTAAEAERRRSPAMLLYLEAEDRYEELQITPD
jgi:GGDEF domain-containing protein